MDSTDLLKEGYNFGDFFHTESCSLLRAGIDYLSRKVKINMVLPVILLIDKLLKHQDTSACKESSVR